MLKAKTSKNGELSITGTDHDHQLTLCENQGIPRQDIRRKITVTKIK